MSGLAVAYLIATLAFLKEFGYIAK